MAEAQNVSVPKGKGERGRTGLAPTTPPREPAWLVHEGDGPVEWWADERYLLLYFMRRASGEGLPRLVEDLEGLREKATVQLALAERDMDRRYYVVPRRAARGAGG